MTDGRVASLHVEALGAGAPSAQVADLHAAVLGVPTSTTAVISAALVQVLGVPSTQTDLQVASRTGSLWIKNAGGAWAAIPLAG